MLTMLAAPAAPVVSAVTHSELWPAVSAISEAALAVLAFLGLIQLWLAKEGLAQTRELARTAAQRESYKLAADQCGLFYAEALPAIIKMQEVLRPTGYLNTVDKYTLGASNGVARLTPEPPPNDEVLDAISDPHLKIVLAVVQALERFAVPFISRIADPEVAFSSVGVTYCTLLKQYALVLLAILEADSSTFKLFALWQGEIDRSDLLKKQEQLERELAAKPKVCVKPIGT